MKSYANQHVDPLLDDDEETQLFDDDGLTRLDDDPLGNSLKRNFYVKGASSRPIMDKKN